MNDRQVANMQRQINSLALAPKQKKKGPKARGRPNNKGQAKFVDVPVPAAIGTRVNGRAPSLNGRRSVLVCNTEYATVLTSQTALSINGISGGATIGVNPGNPLLFPWLSSIASSFEEYRFKALKFHFKSFTPTSERGRLTMALDYDAADPVPTSYQELCVNDDFLETNVWKTATLTSRSQYRDLNAKFRYVRAGPVPTNTDVKTYDVAQLLIATSSSSGTQDIGDLWVEYECELQIPSGNSLLAALSYHTNRSGGTANSPYLFNLVGQVINTALGNITVPTGTAPTKSITFAAIGQYMIELAVLGTNVVPSTWSSPSGCTVTEQNTCVEGGLVTSWAKVLVTSVPATVLAPIASYTALSIVDYLTAPISKSF